MPRPSTSPRQTDLMDRDPAPLYPSDPPDDAPGPLATMAGLVVGGLAAAGASWWAVRRFRFVDEPTAPPPAPRRR